MYFIEVLLYDHFLSEMLHMPLFLYFPQASVLLFYLDHLYMTRQWKIDAF